MTYTLQKLFKKRVRVASAPRTVIPLGVDKAAKTTLAIFKKDVVTFLQRLQCMLLRIYQYRMKVPGTNIFLGDCLLRQNHAENKDEEI